MKCTITRVDEMQGKSGRPYWMVHTSQGKASTASEELAYNVSRYVGQEVDVEIVTNDKGYINFLGFTPLLSSVPKESHIRGQSAVVPVLPQIDGRSADIQASVAFKGAIDLACAGKIEVSDIGKKTGEFITVLKSAVRL